MDNAIVIIHAADIPAARQTINTLTSYQVLVFDPTLVDSLAASGFENIVFLAWDNAPDYPAIETFARASALAIERKIDQLLHQAFSEFPVLQAYCFLAWQYLNWYYLIVAHQWYAGLWPAMLARLSHYKLHIFMCENPVQHYFPAFLPALLLMQQLRSQGIFFEAFSYRKAAENSLQLLAIDKPNEEYAPCDVLSHLPTCFYDFAYFNAELQASGLSVVDIQAKYYGVPVYAERKILCADFAEQQLSIHWPERAVLQAWLSKALGEFLQPFIATPLYREKQASYWCDLYLTQMLSLDTLEQYFAQQRPKKILVSDHDTGFHGPLMSYAQRYAIPVVMLPHAKTSASTEFVNRNLTMLTHPLQAAPLLNGEGQQLLHFPLAYPETFSARSAGPATIQKTGVLLNGLALNGVLCTDYKTYIQGLVRIKQWADDKGIELVIRSRPGQFMFRLLNKACGIEVSSLQNALAMTLPEFVQSLDICLMYDAPTSAGIECLRSGVPLLNPIPAALGLAEGLGANSQLVPRANVADTLLRLDSFVQDPSLLGDFSRQQFAGYTALFAAARGLRRFL